MKAIVAFFRSTKLAIVLILFLTGTLIFASLIPQGRADSFYLERYSRAIARLILITGFDTFIASVVFLFPLALFFLNLLTCSVSRIILELRGQRKIAPGPDIIHLGLLILVAGSILSASTRETVEVFAAEGDRIILPGEYELGIESFEFQTYTNGRPRDWITTVVLQEPIGGAFSKHAIEVNHPLSVGNLKIYQSSFREAVRGEGDAAEKTLETGLLIKKERGFGIVLAACIIVCSGLAVTYGMKAKEERK